MLLSFLLGLLFPAAVAFGPSCVDGLALDCAFLAAAEAHEQNPTKRTRRELKRLARRGHVGAQVLLVTSAEHEATPQARTKAARSLADRGISHGFERWGLALAEAHDSPDKASAALGEAILRGPKEAMMTFGVVGLQTEGMPEYMLRVWVSTLVAACMMSSEHACYTSAKYVWETGASHHDRKLARWLAELAVELEGQPHAKKLLSLIILESDPDTVEADIAVSLLLPLSEEGDRVAMARLADALTKRGAEGDLKGALAWLSASVRAGSVEGAQRFCLSTSYFGLEGSDRDLASDTSERAMLLLRQHSPEVYFRCGGLQRRDGKWVDRRLGTIPVVDPIEAALDAARGGSLHSLGVLARLVDVADGRSTIVSDRDAFLDAVEESLCAVGTEGIPYYLGVVRTLGGTMDVITQAAWLFLVEHQRPWEPERPIAYADVRDEVWADLTAADLIKAESRATELRERIATNNPDCALVR